jgi:hypothetical protein
MTMNGKKENKMNLQNFKDKLAKELFGQTVNESQSTGLCIQCKEPAIPKCYSEAGKREYYISGLCEKCYDEMWEEGK